MIEVVSHLLPPHKIAVLVCCRRRVELSARAGSDSDSKGIQSLSIPCYPRTVNIVVRVCGVIPTVGPDDKKVGSVARESRLELRGFRCANRESGWVLHRAGVADPGAVKLTIPARAVVLPSDKKAAL